MKQVPGITIALVFFGNTFKFALDTNCTKWTFFYVITAATFFCYYSVCRWIMFVQILYIYYGLLILIKGYSFRSPSFHSFEYG